MHSQRARRTFERDTDRSRPGIPRDARSRPILRVAFAVILGAGLAVLWLRLFPGQLPEQTDIVGYPIFANFNVVRYLHVYHAITLVFPLATLASFAALGLVSRWVRGEHALPGLRMTGRPTDEPPPQPNSGRVAHLGRAVLVGAVLGLESSYSTDGVIGGFWPTVLATTVAYLSLIAGIAAVADRRRHGFWRRHSTVNALVAPLTIAGLYGVSRASQVSVISRGAVDSYSWLPLAVAVAAAAGGLTWVGVRILTANQRGERVAAIERDAVMFFAGSTLLFLLVVQLPGALGYMDLFHEGEGLAAARLTELGLFPWRDLYFVHGPLQDVLSPLLGMKVFEQSRWGATAGLEVLVRPAVAVGFYLLHVRLFRGDWVMLAATGAIVTLGLDPRLLLFPLALLLFLSLLRQPSPLKALTLASILIAQSILTPEAAPLSFAVGFVLPLFEAYYRDPDRRLWVSFPRTLWFVGGALVFALGWLGYLASHGALDDFLGHYLTFARDHELTGGVPIQWGTKLFFFAVVAPVASILLFVFLFALQLRRDRLRVEDWAAAALALFAAFYYRKFLSRADDHAFQVLVVSVPLIGYVVHRTATLVSGGLGDGQHRGLTRALAVSRALSVGMLLIVLVWTPKKGLELLESLPRHFQASTPAPAWFPSLGYSTPEALDRAGFEDLRQVLQVLPNPSGRILDFTNQPAMFHYLLGYRPATRYYHVSLAIRRSTQDDLLAELRADPPGIAVFHAAAGLPGWDSVANSVRHYEISDYVLDHYRPVIIAGGNLVMVRKDLDLPHAWSSGLSLNTPPMPGNPYFYGIPCDWGYAPHFLERDPQPEEAGSRDLKVRKARVGRRGIEFDLPPDFRAYDWLEIRAVSPLRADTFSVRDRLGVITGTIVFRTLEGKAHRYLVRVGSCPQWHGFRRGPLLLLHQKPQDIVAVRLLR